MVFLQGTEQVDSVASPLGVLVGRNPTYLCFWPSVKAVTICVAMGPVSVTGLKAGSNQGSNHLIYRCLGDLSV
jgi:hypothetical protein